MSEHYASGVRKRSFGSLSDAGPNRASRGVFRVTISGYTLLEVVAVLIIAGVLAAVFSSRFIGTSGFIGQTTADKLLVAVRYAEALAQNQDVATTVTVSGSSFSVTQGGAPVANPTLQATTFVVPIPAGVTISSTPTNTVTFTRPGLPSTAVTFQVASLGPTVQIFVTGSGYAYECLAQGPCPP